VSFCRSVELILPLFEETTAQFQRAIDKTLVKTVLGQRGNSSPKQWRKLDSLSR
jgi:hypothetical protein